MKQLLVILALFQAVFLYSQKSHPECKAAADYYYKKQKENPDKANMGSMGTWEGNMQGQCWAYCAAMAGYLCELGKPCDDATYNKVRAGLSDLRNSYSQMNCNVCNDLLSKSIPSHIRGQDGSSTGDGMDGGQGGSGSGSDGQRKAADVPIFNENNHIDFGDHTPTGSLVGDFAQELGNGIKNDIMNNSLNGLAHDLNEDLKGTVVQDAANKLNAWSKPIDIANDGVGDIAGKIGLAGLNAWAAEANKQRAAEEKKQKEEYNRKQREQAVIRKKKTAYFEQRKKLNSLILNSVTPEEEAYYKEYLTNNKNCSDNATATSMCDPAPSSSAPVHAVALDQPMTFYAYFKAKLKLYSTSNIPADNTEAGSSLGLSSALLNMANSGGDNPGTIADTPDKMSKEDFEILNNSLAEMIRTARKKYPDQQLSYYMAYEYYVAKNAENVKAFKEISNALLYAKSSFKPELSPNLPGTKQNAISNLTKIKDDLVASVVNELKSDISSDNTGPLLSLQKEGVLQQFNVNDVLTNWALWQNALQSLKLLTNNFANVKSGFVKDVISQSLQKDRVIILAQFFNSSPTNKAQINAETQNGRSLFTKAVQAQKHNVLYFCEKFQGIDCDKEFEKSLASDRNSAIVIARHFLNLLYITPNDKSFEKLANASLKLFGDRRLVKTYTFYDDANILQDAVCTKREYVLNKVMGEFSDNEIKNNPDLFNNAVLPIIKTGSYQQTGFNQYYTIMKNKPRFVTQSTLDLAYEKRFIGFASLLELSTNPLQTKDAYEDNYLLKSIIANDQFLSAELLKSKLFDVNYKNKAGNNALILACQRQDVSLVEELLKNGAEPNAVCQSDFTPLMVAVIKQNTALASILVKHNANPKIKNKNKNNCFDLISSERYYPNAKEMTKILKGQ